MTGEDGGRLVLDSDGVRVKGGRATSITELANGQKGCVGEGGEQVGDAGRGRQSRKIKLGDVGGDHGGMIWKLDGDGRSGGAFVACVDSLDGKEMASATSVGNERDEWRGGT